MALTKMTQSELANELADKTSLSRAEARKVLAALEDIVSENLQACVRTQVAGVTIEPKLRKATKARMGRNPATGEEIRVSAKPASVRVAMRASNRLKGYAPTTRKLNAAL